MPVGGEETSGFRRDYVSGRKYWRTLGELWRCGREGQALDVEDWREEWNKRGQGEEVKRCDGMDAMEERKGENGIGVKREK